MTTDVYFISGIKKLKPFILMWRIFHLINILYLCSTYMREKWNACQSHKKNLLHERNVRTFKFIQHSLSLSSFHTHVIDSYKVLEYCVPVNP